MLPIPTQFNYVDFLCLKDFLHRLSSFAAEGDESCFTKLVFPPLTPVTKRGNLEQAGKRSGHGKLPMPGSWRVGTAGKGTTAPCMAQNRPGGFSGGNTTRKGNWPLTEEGSHSITLSSLIRTGCWRLCPRVPQGGSSTKVKHTLWDSSPVYQWHHFVTGMQVQQMLELLVCWQWLLWEPIMWHVMARRPLHIHI